MSVATLLVGLAPVLPQLVTGICTAGGAVTAGLGAVVLTQRYNERQRARERDSVTNTKIEETTRELFEAVSELHLALTTYQPVHNTWQPRLLLLGSAILEFMAGKQSGGLALGAVQAGRIAVEANERELLAAQALKAPMQRVLAAAARASLLPDGDVRNAAMRLGEIAAEAGQAYGQDNLWKRGEATAARAQADAALLAALRELVDAASSHLHPQEQPRWRWPLRLTSRRRNGEQPAAAPLPAKVPGARDGDHDAVPAAATPTLPAGQPDEAAAVSATPPRRGRRRP
ncbi:hypothetical protein [Micromonospora aurantiaca (nom. illeg.)]|uniref:hypothetical protein n=1 Tax=Micromonospora aurantiaca (nom. illeg.) TaxID=47850 RepID=UPI00114CA1E2|nr:hypothetical protein [Micromonospora aurantiaca]